MTSKLYRNDTKNLLGLFRLKVPNGHIRIKNLVIDSNLITIKFDLIKFYKEIIWIIYI